MGTVQGSRIEAAQSRRRGVCSVVSVVWSRRRDTGSVIEAAWRGKRGQVSERSDEVQALCPSWRDAYSMIEVA